MPSTPTTRLRAEKQALGENASLWGSPKLNAVIDRLEEGICGVTSIAIAGTATTLTATNYSADQARYAALIFTGTLTANSTITVPNVEKLYVIVNNTTMGAYSLTIKTSAGTGYALRPGPQQVYCDGTDCYRGTPTLEQLPIGQVAADSSGNIGVGYSTVPTGGSAVRVLAVKGPNSGGGYGTLQVEGGTTTKTAIFQISGSAGDVDLGTQTTNTTGRLNLLSGGAERARVTSTGELLVGVTSLLSSSAAVGAIVGRHVSGVRTALRLEDDSVAAATLANFVNQNGVIGSITSSASGVSFNTSSDYRLKEGVEPLTLAVDRLSALRPKRFAFKGDPTNRVDGLIAHEVQAVCPYAVTGEQDGPEMQQVDYSKLVPLLIGAVQELTRRVELLEDAV